MPKNIMEDITPPERKSIRNIPLPNGRKVKLQKRPIYDPSEESATPEQHDEPIIIKDREEVVPVPKPPTPPPPATSIYNNFNNPYARRRNGIPKLWLWVVTVVAVIILLIATTPLWTKAIITITPKTQTSPVQETLRAGPENNLMAYQLVELSGEAGKEVVATGEEHVDLKASGKIIVYNNHDDKSQKLIKNTRFETPEGLIYRVAESITVPGQSTKDGKTVPGNLEVTVFADEPGEKYNIGLTKFTIPGFEGDPRFETFSAESKIAMTGGFSGNRKKVESAIREQALTELRNQLKQNLLAQARSQLSEDVVLYDSATSFTFEELPQTNDTGSKVTLNQKATLIGAAFNKTTIGSLLAERLLPGTSGEVELANATELVFTPTESDFNPRLNQTFDFTISGNANLVWVFDETLLKQDLLEKPKKNLSSILSKYEAITKAQAVIRPFWKRTFPKDPKDIAIELVMP